MEISSKQIIPYLPYGLNIKILNHKCDYVGIEHAKANGFYFVGDSIHVTYEGGSTGKDIKTFKPIFRTMSDLKLQFFKDNIDSDIIDFRFDCDEDIFSVEVCDKIVGWTALSLQEYLLFFLNHFDVFGLIDADLAIDINTVPELLNG